MAPARSHQDEGSDAPQSGTLSASPTAAATVAGDSTTNGRHGRENENGNGNGNGNAEGQRGAGAGAGDIAQAATALEANLAKLESRLDELLAGFETDELRNASSGGKGPAEK
ncbi:Beta-mannosidase B [Verticillium dahliae VDG2]|nr:Beta-mannosidase B [Verticillium dahliae VDG2]